MSALYAKNDTTNLFGCKLGDSTENNKALLFFPGKGTTGIKGCLFDMNLSIKPVKKVFVYKCKLSLSLALLYLVDLFIDKLKTKLIVFFTE